MINKDNLQETSITNIELLMLLEKVFNRSCRECKIRMAEAIECLTQDPSFLISKEYANSKIEHMTKTQID